MRTIILAALAAFSAFAMAACETSGGTLMSRNQVMEVSRRMTAEYAAAWNANDMNRFGALYAEEARHVTMSGEFLRGRDQIVAAHRANRARYAENVRMATRLEGARAITNDTIVAVMIIEYVSDQSDRNVQAARLTCTLARQNFQWTIAQAHASPATETARRS
jgi:uncharacterized protein (TIGR02246 family)